MINFTDVSCYWHILDTFCIGVNKYGLWSEQGFCRELKVPSCESPAAAVQDIKGHCNSHKNGPLFYPSDLFNRKICFQGYMNWNPNKGARKERQPRDGVSTNRRNFKHHAWEQWKEQGRVSQMMQVWSRDSVVIYWFWLVLNEDMKVRFTGCLAQLCCPCILNKSEKHLSASCRLFIFP